MAGLPGSSLPCLLLLLICYASYLLTFANPCTSAYTSLGSLSLFPWIYTPIRYTLDIANWLGGKKRLGVMHSAIWLSRSLVDLGKAERVRSCSHRGSARAPTRGNYLLHLRGEVRHGLIYTLFPLLQAPRSTGMTHPEMQVF